MKRPGPAGLLLLLAFAIVFAIEFNTILGMIGIEIPSHLYFPLITLVIVAVFGGLLLLPEGTSQESTKADVS